MAPDRGFAVVGMEDAVVWPPPATTETSKADGEAVQSRQQISQQGQVFASGWRSHLPPLQKA